MVVAVVVVVLLPLPLPLLLDTSRPAKRAQQHKMIPPVRRSSPEGNLIQPSSQARRPNDHMDFALHADATINLRVLMSFSTRSSPPRVVLCESLMTDFLQTIDSVARLVPYIVDYVDCRLAMMEASRDACALRRRRGKCSGPNRSSSGRQGSWWCRGGGGPESWPGEVLYPRMKSAPLPDLVEVQHRQILNPSLLDRLEVKLTQIHYASRKVRLVLV